MTTWVDTHCHLFGSPEPAAALLERARSVGVGWTVCPGIDETRSRRAVSIATEFEGQVLAAVGVHPHYADVWADQRDAIAELAPDAVAVGECGLDFYRDLSPRDVQVTAFTEQVVLAEQLDKPLIVHCRDAFAEVHAILERTGVGGRAVLHCWTGGPRWTKRFAELGVTFGFAGPIAFETGDTVRRAAAVAPPQRTMVETDTPYLSPPPHRGEDNEPARVVIVGAALAAVWGESIERVAELTTETAQRVFRG